MIVHGGIMKYRLEMASNTFDPFSRKKIATDKEAITNRITGVKAEKPFTEGKVTFPVIEILDTCRRSANHQNIN